MSSIFYIGGYQKDNAYCLHCCEYSGSAMRILESYQIGNASYLCLSPDKKYLYAVIETETFEGVKGGGVAAFAVEAGGKLRFINAAPTEGAHPCHLSVSSDGCSLYVANYSGGSTTFFNLLKDGGIGSKRALVKHSDFGAPSMVVANRQGNPHAHFIQPMGYIDRETLWVCDLGLDLLLVLDDKGSEIARLAMPGGFGPRHLAFHPNLPVVYVVGELFAEVIAVSYSVNPAGLLLTAGAPVSVSPDAKVSCAAIKVAPDIAVSVESGLRLSPRTRLKPRVLARPQPISNRNAYSRRLLVSNRGGGADSLSVLELDENGGITGLSHVYKTRGKCPRDFAFTPEGDGVVVAYQDSDFVELLKWDGSGTLVPTQVELEVAKPACVLFEA